MSKDFEKDIEACLKTLNNKGTILYPTDTVWGLGCDVTNEMTVNKIFEIKNRPKHKSFIVLVNSFAMLKHYVSDVNNNLINFLSAIEKPTTVIYNNVQGFAPSVYADDGSVAIRVCKDEFCNELINRFDKPIVSTSANISGEPTARFFSEINPAIIQATDYTVFYKREALIPAAPSAIVQFIEDGIKIIRE